MIGEEEMTQEEYDMIAEDAERDVEASLTEDQGGKLCLRLFIIGCLS